MLMLSVLRLRSGLRSLLLLVLLLEFGVLPPTPDFHSIELVPYLVQSVTLFGYL